MFQRILGSADTGRLIVTGVAACVDPTGLALSGFGLDALIKARDQYLAKHPALAMLAREIDEAFHGALAEPSYDKPEDARELLPQMLAVAMTHASDFVECDLDPDAILRELTQRFRASDQPDHRRDDILSAFDRLYRPLLTQTCNDPRLKAALDPALYRSQRAEQRDMAERQRAMEQKIDRLLAQNEGLIGVVRKLAEGSEIDPDAMLTLPEMQLLAARFGEDAIECRSALLQFLTLKAEEYDSLKHQVEAIDDGLKRLSNLKAAAQDAIARVDLEEVETLLSRVQEVELEEAARTAELRAENALLRGRVDQAYRLFCAAADSFAGVDEEEPAHRRNRYRETLYQHALRYGGDGLTRAAEIIRPAIALLEKTGNKTDWATTTQNLAIALETQGSRTAGEAGTALLAEAVAAYREALSVFTEATHPVR